MKVILLIHDNLDVIVGLGEFLNQSGYLVIPKISHESALSVLKEEVRIDLVIFGFKKNEDRDFLINLKNLIPSVPLIVIANGITASSILN